MSSFLERHRTICAVIQEIREEASRYTDEALRLSILKLCDEAQDYAQRMSARLHEHKAREIEYDGR